MTSFHGHPSPFHSENTSLKHLGGQQYPLPIRSCCCYSNNMYNIFLTSYIYKYPTDLSHLQHPQHPHPNPIPSPAWWWPPDQRSTARQTSSRRSRPRSGAGNRSPPPPPTAAGAAGRWRKGEAFGPGKVWMDSVWTWGELDIWMMMGR